MEELTKKYPHLESIIAEVTEVAGYLWRRGWAERNAGNISVNIGHLMDNEAGVTDELVWHHLPTTYPNLSKQYFLVTATGKRMRDLAKNPSGNALIIQLNLEANSFCILSRDANDAILPTSELPTHLGIHQMIAARGSREKVVMHSHVTELIALTQAKEHCNKTALNRLLFAMHPETIIFVPKGVGFVPYLLPGSEAIAEATLKALEQHDVALWEKHGVFSIGEQVGATFDVLDILAKSAAIYMMCKSANIIPEGFTDEQLAELKLLADKF